MRNCVTVEVHGVCNGFLTLNACGTPTGRAPLNCRVCRDQDCIRSRHNVPSRFHRMTILPLLIGNFIGQATLVKGIFVICQAPREIKLLKTIFRVHNFPSADEESIVYG
jgi:hypothetical protein